ncbi:MAG: ATP-binding protein, partial [Lentisphaeraceae bacterium]|nr:ATP-binding protein [Lentisphaeraceae bacterium]
SFVEYQGSNLTHWSFADDEAAVENMKAQYLCGQAFLIADGDVANKGERVKLYEKMLDERFVILSCKEIENLIPEEVLLGYLESKKRLGVNDFSKVKGSEYSEIDYGLGRYLDSKLEIKKFATKSGTMKGKVDFCKAIVKLISDKEIKFTWPAELKALCEKIFAHINPVG